MNSRDEDDSGQSIDLDTRIENVPWILPWLRLGLQAVGIGTLRELVGRTPSEISLHPALNGKGRTYLVAVEKVMSEHGLRFGQEEGR